MPKVMPPPSGRFDPITGIWTAPSGSLPDPQRDADDPERDEPVSLVGPVPAELAEPRDELQTARLGGTPTQRLRWAIFAIIAAGAAAVVLGTRLGSCLDVGGCSMAWTWWPGWIVVGALVALAAFAVWRVLSLSRDRSY